MSYVRLSFANAPGRGGGVGILIGYHAFDLSILYSRREVNHFFSAHFDNSFLPGGGDFDNFF